MSLSLVAFTLPEIGRKITAFLRIDQIRMCRKMQIVNSHLQNESKPIPSCRKYMIINNYKYLFLPREYRENFDETTSDYGDKILRLLKLYRTRCRCFEFFYLLSCDYAFFVVPLCA